VLALPPASVKESPPRDILSTVQRLKPGHEARVLVVDAIRENRDVLSTMLAMIGCEIVLAENGRQALEAVAVSRPDLVFMDMRLPEIEGLEAARRMVGEYGPRGLKVVATSASVLAHEREILMRAGCDDFIAKPFRCERIYASLQQLLGIEFEYRAAEEARKRGETIDLRKVILPEDLALRLMMAAELHSATVLKACLGEVAQLGPAGERLAAHLRQFMASYDMETIQKLVAQIPVACAAAAPGTDLPS
jgi:CheY-like chemotaxis protein